MVEGYSILEQCLTKLLKYTPQDSSARKTISSYNEKLKRVSKDEIKSENGYWKCFKEVILLKDSKILNIVLCAINELITHDFIDCKAVVEDSDYNPGISDAQITNTKRNNAFHSIDLSSIFTAEGQSEEKLVMIDVLTDITCNCYTLVQSDTNKHLNIIIQVVQVLLNIFILSQPVISVKTLNKIFRTYFEIEANSNQTELRNSTRAALMRICNTVIYFVECSLIILEHPEIPNDLHQKLEVSHHGTSNLRLGGFSINEMSIRDHSSHENEPSDESTPIRDPHSSTLNLNNPPTSFNSSHTVSKLYASEPSTGALSTLRLDFVNIDEIRSLEERLHSMGITSQEYNNHMVGHMSYLVKTLSRASTYCNPRVSRRFNAGSEEHIELNEDTSALLAEENVIRTLAVELILTIIINARASVKSHKIFLNLIKHHVCPVVVSNANASNPKLFEYTCSIFLDLVHSYRSFLKREIEHIIASAYMRVLEADTCHLWKKLLVMKTLREICKDYYVLADIYYNFDCDLESVSLFEKIVTACCRIIQIKPQYKGGNGLLEIAVSAVGLDIGIEEVRLKEREFKSSAISCLLDIVNSILSWVMDTGRARKSDPASVTDKVHSIDKSTNHNGREDSSSPDTCCSQISDACTDRSLHEDERGLKLPSSPKEHRLENSPKIFSKSPSTHLSIDFTLYNNTVKCNSVDNPNDTNSAHFPDPNDLVERKNQLFKLIKIFNLNPYNGIQLLVNNSFIDDTPHSIASFLFNAKGISKASIGEYLGRNTPISLHTLEEFVKCFNFKNKKLVESLRIFLSTFRLPGEAQIIDRIIQKFSEHYFYINPEAFTSFDSIYTLSFSIIMLNTDLHSNQIRNKMTLKQFIKNHKNLPGLDFSDSLLTEIYEDIRKNEIKQPDTINTNRLAVIVKNWKDTSGEFTKNPQNFLLTHNNTRPGFPDPKNGNMQSTTPAVNFDLFKHMFQVYLWPINVSLSAVFEYDEYKDMDDFSADVSKRSEVEECLYIYMMCIYLCAEFDMDEEKSALLNILSRLTGLHKQEPLGINGYKVLCALVYIANNMGDYLGSSWTCIMVPILQLYNLAVRFSKIVVADYTLYAAKRSPSNVKPSDNKAKSSGYKSTDTGGKTGVVPRSRPRIFEIFANKDLLFTKDNGDTMSTVNDDFDIMLSTNDLFTSVENIFTGTKHLKYESMINFIHSLCSASLLELGYENSNRESTLVPIIKLSNTQSMTALLMKLVEVVSYNIGRPAKDRNMICLTINKYFEKVFVHKNVEIIKIAVDSVMRIAMCLLGLKISYRDPSQSIIMSIFRQAVVNSSDDSVLQNILLSIEQIINKEGVYVSSAWTEIFSTITTISEKISSRPDSSIEVFRVVGLIVNHEHLRTIARSGQYSKLIDCIYGLTHFEDSHDSDKLLNNYAKALKKCSNFLEIYYEEVFGDDDLRKNSKYKSESRDDHHFSEYLLTLVLSCCKMAENSKSPIFRIASIETLDITLKLLQYGLPGDWINVQECIFNSMRRKLTPTPNTDDFVDASLLEDRLSEANISIIRSFLHVYIRALSLSFEYIICYNQGYIFRSLLDSLVELTKLQNPKLLSVLLLIVGEVIRYNAVHYYNYKFTWSIIEDCLKKFYDATTSEVLLVKENKKETDGNFEVLEESSIINTDNNIYKINKNKIEVSSDTSDLFKSTLSKYTSQLGFVYLLNNFYPMQMIVPKDYENCTTFKVVNNQSNSDIVNFNKNLTVLQVEKSDHYTKVPIGVFFPDELLDTVAHLLLKSYNVALSFNQNDELKRALYKSHLTPQLPCLTRQECSAFSGYSILVFLTVRTYIQDLPLKRSAKKVEEHLNLFIEYSLKVLQKYAALSQNPNKYKSYLSIWSSVIAIILSNISLFISLICPENREKVNAKTVDLDLSVLNSNIYAYYRVGLSLCKSRSPEVLGAAESLLVTIGEVCVKPTSLSAINNPESNN